MSQLGHAFQVSIPSYCTLLSEQEGEPVWPLGLGASTLTYVEGHISFGSRQERVQDKHDNSRVKRLLQSVVGDSQLLPHQCFLTTREQYAGDQSCHWQHQHIFKFVKKKTKSLYSEFQTNIIIIAGDNVHTGQ